MFQNINELIRGMVSISNKIYFSPFNITIIISNIVSQNFTIISKVIIQIQNQQFFVV